MFTTAKRRRQEQIAEAARYMVDGPVGFEPLGDYDVQLTPKTVATLAYMRHDIQVTEQEARDALGTALAKRGYGPDRITSGYDR